MTRHRSLLLVGVLSFLTGRHAPAASHGGEGDRECDACAFDDNDAPDCKVYGELHTGGLIAWHRAPEKCLDFYNLHTASVDHEAILEIWPNSNADNGNLEKFINYIRYREDRHISGDKINSVLLKRLPQFFTDSLPDRGEGEVIFHDRVNVGETYFDCTNNVNGEANCWTAVREWMAQPAGISELRNMGLMLLRYMRHDAELEQQSARIAICADMTGSEQASTEICGPLVTQIHEMQRGDEQKDCSLYGLGPKGVHNNHVETNCRLDSGGGQVPDKDGTRSTSAAAGIKAAHLLSIPAVVLCLLWQ